MNAAIVSALAALAGSALGALTPITTNHFLQKSQTQRELLTGSYGFVKILYSQFIQAAARVYGSAVTSNLERLDDVVELYAFVGRIRLISRRWRLIRRMRSHIAQMTADVLFSTVAALTDLEIVEDGSGFPTALQAESRQRIR